MPPARLHCTPIHSTVPGARQRTQKRGGDSDSRAGRQSGPGATRASDAFKQVTTVSRPCRDRSAKRTTEFTRRRARTTSRCRPPGFTSLRYTALFQAPDSGRRKRRRFRFSGWPTIWTRSHTRERCVQSRYDPCRDRSTKHATEFTRAGRGLLLGAAARLHCTPVHIPFQALTADEKRVPMAAIPILRLNLDGAMARASNGRAMRSSRSTTVS